MKVKHHPVSAMNLWQDFSTEGTTTFDVFGQTVFLHILRKHDKVSFSVRQLKEIRDSRSKSKPLSKWVTLISFTVSVSKKGRLAAYLSRKVSRELMNPISYGSFKSSAAMRLKALLEQLSAERAINGKGVVNITSYIYEAITLLVDYLNNVETESLSLITGQKLPPSSVPEVSMRYFCRELEALLKRNDKESEPLESLTSESLDRYITNHSYPLANVFPKIREHMWLCSYDGAEAVSAENFEAAVRRATFKREESLINLLHTLDPSDNPDSPLNEIMFIDIMNCLTVTKSYVPDDERLKLTEKLISAGEAGKSEKITNKHWEILRKTLKQAKEDPIIRKACLDILLKRASINNTGEYIRDLYIANNNREGISSEVVVSNASTIYSESVVSNSSWRYDPAQDMLGIQHNYVPDSWSIYPSRFIKTFCQRLEMLTRVNHNSLSRIPKRIVSSYKRHLAYGSVLGLPISNVNLFLEDERNFLKRKAKRLGFTLTEDEADRLLALSLAYCEESFIFSERRKRRKVADIPEKVFKAVKDKVHDDLIVETVLTEEEDYELIKDTFVLPEPFRHAILKIKIDKVRF